jgi:L,D-peptidoglycan transpeptidase YkuD (ErfK/YbiS/YcfS/YnhG family)
MTNISRRLTGNEDLATGQKGSLCLWVAAASILLTLVPTSVGNGMETGSPIPPFIQECIARNAPRIEKSKQLIFATNTDASSSFATIHVLEKDRRVWVLAFPAFSATIGEKGFAPFDIKREGDGKSPTGIFLLGTAFGNAASIETRMPYRQATADDFWVDDPDAEDYNQWVRGKPRAASYEKMKREDDLYKYGIVIEYNTSPIVKGKGSAIFLHLWRGEGKPTFGCVAMPEDKILKILGWLDPNRRPLIVMGTESGLRSMGSP